VRVPEPIATERNVLVMEYIGTEDDRAKRLGEVHIENPQTAYEVMREYMRRLYSAGLIHGDLSEYNVVFDESEGQLVFIDLGQAVTVHHPNSREFLERDCRNVANFFSRQGLEVAEGRPVRVRHESGAGSLAELIAVLASGRPERLSGSPAPERV